MFLLWNPSYELLRKVGIWFLLWVQKGKGLSWILWKNLIERWIFMKYDPMCLLFHWTDSLKSSHSKSSFNITQTIKQFTFYIPLILCLSALVLPLQTHHANPKSSHQYFPLDSQTPQANMAAITYHTSSATSKTSTQYPSKKTSQTLSFSAHQRTKWCSEISKSSAIFSPPTWYPVSSKTEKMVYQLGE